LRINIIHDQDNYIRWYVNGILKCEQRDTEVGVDNYHKYGCYGTTSGNVPAIVKWRAVKSFKDGFPPGHTVSPVPAVFTLNPGSSVTSRVDVSSFTGNVTLSISNLPAGAAATFNPATIPGGVGSSTLTVTTLNNLAPGNYPLAIKGTDSSTNITATLNLGVIPVGWTGKDIGGPGEAGWASFSAGVFTLNGGGNDIWSSADKFNYAFKPLPGDTTITARVDLQEHTNPWAKAGVMFRDSTNASARYVGLYVTPSNGVSMQFRSATGSNAVDHARHTGISAPHWVRLARNGNSFSGFRSSDGANWIQVGSTSFAMSNTALVGLALTSHDDAVLNTSTFSSVSAPAPRPRFTSIVQYASSLALAGTNGVAGQTYYTLVTTNLASPVVNWMRVATNQFGPNGSFAFTNAFNAASPHLYLLQMP
jgi:regulation of enolase protein 1 (concanavalin A-like superfamily)